eukprot:6198085-Pyramimonas_sp.AAC.1
MGPRSALLGRGDASDTHHWGLRWTSLRGQETLYWVGETHVIHTAGALGGPPYGATNRCTG